MIIHKVLDGLFSSDDYRAVHLVINRNAYDPASFKALSVGGGQSKVLAEIEVLPEDFHEAAQQIRGVIVPLLKLYEGSSLDFVPSTFTTGIQDTEEAQAIFNADMDILDEAIKGLNLDGSQPSSDESQSQTEGSHSHHLNSGSKRTLN